MDSGRVDAVVALRDAAAADQAARREADQARASLRAAAVQAHRAGVGVTTIARLAGVGRRHVYTWLDQQEEDPGQASPAPGP